MKIYNVMQYGAKGDGKTNDAFSIQHAVRVHQILLSADRKDRRCHERGSGKQPHRQHPKPLFHLFFHANPSPSC